MGWEKREKERLNELMRSQLSSWLDEKLWSSKYVGGFNVIYDSKLALDRSLTFWQSRFKDFIKKCRVSDEQ